jgi:hypothetical protein
VVMHIVAAAIADSGLMDTDLVRKSWILISTPAEQKGCGHLHTAWKARNCLISARLSRITQNAGCNDGCGTSRPCPFRFRPACKRGFVAFLAVFCSGSCRHHRLTFCFPSFPFGSRHAIHQVQRPAFGTPIGGYT